MSQTLSIETLKQNADQCRTTAENFTDRTEGWHFIGREVHLLNVIDRKHKDRNLWYIELNNAIVGCSYIPIIGQIMAIVLLGMNSGNFHKLSDSYKARLIIQAVGLGPLCILVDAVCSTAAAVLAQKALNAKEKYDQARML